MENHPNWRPVVLRPWYLTLVSLLSIALAVGMEFTYQHYDQKEDSSLFSFHDDISDLSLLQYFVWRILLSLIVLAWGGLIASINCQLMRTAPFYRLMRRKGLSGNDAFLRNPASYWTYFCNPKKAGTLEWICFFNVLLANIIAPTVQSTVFLSTNPPDTSLTGEAYIEDAAQRVSDVVIRSAGSRGLSAIFVLVAVSCLSLMIILLRRKSGVLQDPGGVSGVASLVIHSNISHLFDVDLRKVRFQLKGGNLMIQANDQRQTTQPAPRDPSSYGHSIYSRWLLSSTIVFGLFLCIFCGVSAYTNLVWSLRRVPWLIVAFAVLYKQLWTQCEAAFRVTEPFRQLRRGAAPPINLFIDYTGLPVILLPFSALLNGHWMLYISAMASNLTELLVIAVTCTSDISAYIFVSSVSY
jgi:hypothetical protein